MDLSSKNYKDKLVIDKKLQGQSYQLPFSFHEYLTFLKGDKNGTLAN